MKSKTWDAAILSEHRSSIKEESGREAFDAMVAAAIELPGYDAEPGWQGEVRIFKYVDAVSGERPFAFIINRRDLLFYVRDNGRDRVPGGFAALKLQFDAAIENHRGEWTVRIGSTEDAVRLNELLFSNSGGKAAEAGIEDARSVIMHVLPDPLIRQALLHQLIRSSESAEAIAPKAWGATLLKDGFRLNVGQIEVFVLRGDFVRLNLVGIVGRAPFRGSGFQEAGYKSVPESCAFVDPPADLVPRLAMLQEAHLLFVHRAATTQCKRPGKTPVSAPVLMPGCALNKRDRCTRAHYWTGCRDWSSSASKP